MRVVVTGCAGFIGSHLVEALLAEGHVVEGVDSFTDNYAPELKLGNVAGSLAHPAFTLHRLDLARAPLASLLDGADAVFHLAGEPGVRTSFGAGALRHHRQNVVATRRLVSAIRPGTRLVLASSSSVHAAASPYADSKRTAERIVLEAAERRGFEAVVLRPFTVYGPRQRPDMAFAHFLAAGHAGRPLQVHGDGSQVRDFTYVGDVVDAFVRAGSVLGAGGLVLDVGSGEPATVHDAIGLVAELVERPLDVRFGPEMPGDVPRTCADPCPARDALGWVPLVGLRAGLASQCRAGAIALSA